MQIVTSGSQFMDIDAYAGCIAYAELLDLLGVQAKAVSTAPLNESITPTVLGWGASFETKYKPSVDDSFSIIDISEPEFFDRIVDLNKVTRVIDHHTGFEKYWESLGNAATIEHIGAACTLVYEEWVVAEKLADISETSARLLVTGMLDNTLNFRAGVTTDRDRKAYKALKEYANLPEDWPAQYFAECQLNIEADLPAAIHNDAKTIRDTKYLPVAFGQLVVWDAAELIANRHDEIAETMATMNSDWAMNLVSIGENKSYFLADNPATQAKFGELMGTDLSSGIAEADRLYLRKEILKKAQEKAA